MSRSSARIEISVKRECKALQAVYGLFVRRKQNPVQHPATIERLGPAEAQACGAKAAKYLAVLASAFGPLDAEVLPPDIPHVDALLIDASGLAALAGGNPAARAHLARAVGSLCAIVVPATALLDEARARIAEAIGEIVPIDTAIARTAAVIMLRSGLTLPFEALSVACAPSASAAGIVTADPFALGALVRAGGRCDLHVFPV